MKMAKAITCFLYTIQPTFHRIGVSVFQAGGYVLAHLVLQQILCTPRSSYRVKMNCDQFTFLRHSLQGNMKVKSAISCRLLFIIHKQKTLSM